MAHKKAGGSTRNGRDSESKRLGVKIFGGQQAAMRSRGYQGSYLAGQESRTQRLHELVDDYIEGRRPK